MLRQQDRRGFKQPSTSSRRRVRPCGCTSRALAEASRRRQTWFASGSTESKPLSALDGRQLLPARGPSAVTPAGWSAQKMREKACLSLARPLVGQPCPSARAGPPEHGGDHHEGPKNGPKNGTKNGTTFG